MENRQRILETLDSWGVAYRLITHEAVYTIADCLRLEGIDWSVTEVPKNVFLCNRQQTSYYLALLRHDLPFRTAVVSRALGVSRLSFAPEDRLPALLGLQAGAVSPLGLLFDEQKQVTLAMEIMDYPLMNSISKALGYAHYLNNPWFQLYPDIGNLSAWDNDVQMELQAGIGHIVAVHVKDTKPGVFKNVPFGEGVVDFERCFETLKQSGYCGPYLIEMWSETAEDPAAEVAKARDWVKARMAKAGMVEAA